MTFEQPLQITTIDDYKTKRREDGFSVDLDTRVIHLTSVVPDFSKASISMVEEAITNPDSYDEKTASFFSWTDGFSTRKIRKALVVRIEYPYDIATVKMGQAFIKQKLTYNKANSSICDDPVLRTMYEYTSMEVPLPFGAENIIRHLGFKFSNACADAMRQNGVPFLGRHGTKVSTHSGFCVVSKPLRDAIAFINCFQISTYLETGEIRFSRKYLDQLTNGRD